MGYFLDAAETILKRTEHSMTAQQLTNAAIDLQLLKFSNGKTPYQTMKAKISVDIKTLKDKSRFKRAGKGLFALREFSTDDYQAKPFQKSIKQSEDVLVFPVELLEKIGQFHGIHRDYQRYASVLLDPSNTLFLPRIRAELDTDYKQVLSYIMVKYHNSILRFVRGSYTSVQMYLKGRSCIGFGGHVQSKDRNLLSFNDSGYQNSVYRELTEELNLPQNAFTDKNIKMIGVLNDDSSTLGKMHFAFLHMLDIDHFQKIPNAKLLKKEKSINQLKFIPISKLGTEFEQYEYWSKLCIKTYFNKSITISASIKLINDFSLSENRKNHIAIVGSIGSGKSEACQLLEKSFGYNRISVGDLLRNYLKVNLSLDPERMKFQDLAHAFIETPDGPAILANTIYQKMSENMQTPYVIDGIRYPKTYELLKQKLKGDLVLIYVDTCVDDAFSFYKNREKMSVSFDTFLKLYQHPVEQKILDFISIANIVIYNNGNKISYLGSLKDYFNQELE